MTAYEMSEKKVRIIYQIKTLEDYLQNNTETVLLTNQEVEEIIDRLHEAISILNDNLKSKG